jgi:hypothetical protein
MPLRCLELLRGSRKLATLEKRQRAPRGRRDLPLVESDHSCADACGTFTSNCTQYRQQDAGVVVVGRFG